MYGVLADRDEGWLLVAVCPDLPEAEELIENASAEAFLVTGESLDVFTKWSPYVTVTKQPSGHVLVCADIVARYAEIWGRIRAQRDGLLRDTDWRMTLDYPYHDQDAWRTYRQQLRDLTNGAERPHDVIWPIPPAE